MPSLLRQDFKYNLVLTKSALAEAFKPGALNILKGNAKHHTNLAKMEQYIDELIQLDNNGGKDEVSIGALEENQRNLLATIQALNNGTNDPKKKVALLKQIVPVINASSYAIQSIKRSTVISQVKDMNIPKEVQNSEQYKAIKKKTNITLQMPQTFSSKNYGENLKTVLHHSDAANAIVDTLMDGLSPLLNSDGVSKDRAEGFNLGTNMITQNIVQLGIAPILESKNTDELNTMIANVPEVYETIKEITGGIDIAVIQRDINAYETYKTLNPDLKETIGDPLTDAFATSSEPNVAQLSSVVLDNITPKEMSEIVNQGGDLLGSIEPDEVAVVVEDITEEQNLTADEQQTLNL